MRLENWVIVAGCCYGNIYGNDSFEDGESVRTSLIKERTKDQIVTQNNTYTLGKPFHADSKK